MHLPSLLLKPNNPLAVGLFQVYSPIRQLLILVPLLFWLVSWSPMLTNCMTALVNRLLRRSPLLHLLFPLLLFLMVVATLFVGTMNLLFSAGISVVLITSRPPDALRDHLTCPAMAAPPKCVNCAGAHVAVSSSCLARRIQVEILKYRSRYNTTFHAATAPVLPSWFSSAAALRRLASIRVDQYSDFSPLTSLSAQVSGSALLPGRSFTDAVPWNNCPSSYWSFLFWICDTLQ